jgi:electron transport complex protein RnfG
MDINVEESDYELLAENGYDSFVINSINKAMDASGNELGIVMDVTTGKGYGGDIEFTVGLRNDGTLNGISLLEINETAGLGMNAEKELVPQFKDKKADVFTVTKTGSISESEIDAISGATITSNAITNGVNACLYYRNYIYGGEENE